MNNTLIQFVNVSKSFDTQVVLDKVNLTVNKGEITTIIGMSGVGKSVLLKHIIGLLTPDTGEILYQGKSISSLSRREKRKVKRKFSYMFQGTALFDSMTVYENISLPLKETSRLSDKEIRKAVNEKLEQLDLQEMGDKFPSQLSGGMKKRVALARALVTRPEIVLFDEPTTGLDPVRINAVHKMISEYQQKIGFTGVIVSHEIPEIFKISQKLIMLHEGSIIYQGSPNDLEDNADPLVTQFISGLETRIDPKTGILKGTSLQKKDKAEKVNFDNGFAVILLKIKDNDSIIKNAGMETSKALLDFLLGKTGALLRSGEVHFKYQNDKIIALIPGENSNRPHSMNDSLIKLIKEERFERENAFSNLDFSIGTGIAHADRDLQLEDIVKAAEADMEDIC